MPLTCHRILRAAAPTLLAASIFSGCRDASNPTLPLPQTPSVVATRSDEGGDVGTASNFWMPLPSLALARAEPAVVTFGSCIWAIGGQPAGSRSIDMVERYCPSVANSWTPGPVLPELLSRFAGVGVIGNKIFVAGGVDTTGHLRNSLYTYTVSHGWRLSAEPLPFAMGCGAGAVSGGKLYVYGWKPIGNVEDPAYGDCYYNYEPVFAVYDPSKSAPPRWRVLPAEPPQPAGDVYRCHHSLASIGSIVYAVGGTTSYCTANYPPFAALAAFNTTTGQWLPFGQVSSPDEGRIGQTAVAANNRLFAIGGFNGYIDWFPGAQIMAYEPSVNAWDPLRDMPSSKTFAGAAVLSTNIVVAGGGGLFGESAEALQLNVPTGCDVHEPDGTVAKANPFPLHSDIDGHLLPPYTMSLARICGANDVDYFLVLNSAVSGTAQVVLTPPAGRDYQLELLNAAGTRVLASSSKPGAVPETVPLPITGRQYLLRVRSQNGSYDQQRPYTLQVQ